MLPGLLGGEEEGVAVSIKAFMAAVAVVAVVGLGLAAVACNDAESNPSDGIDFDITPTDGSPVPIPTKTPVSDEAKTAVAAGGDVEMVSYEDREGRYSVFIPRGWAIETSPDSFSASLAGDPVAATVGIYCGEGMTVDQLIAQDQKVYDQLNLGLIDLTTRQPVEVAGREGRRYTSTGHIGDIPLQRTSVYFTGGDCAWRMLLTTWPGTSIEELSPVLNRMMDSFELS